MNSGTKVIGIVVVVGGIIIGASVWLGRQNPPKAVESGPQLEHPLIASAVPKTSNASPAPGITILKTTPVTTNSQTQSVAAVTSAPGAGLITNWNESIDEVLKSGAEDRDVAKSLLKSFPKYPADGQVEAVQHISNLLPDEDYPELAKLMEDDKLPEDVLDQLIMDLLNRPNKIMLPELVKVARNSQHAKAGEAKDFLELYLEEDYGADWNLWQTKVDEWLKANPDE
jgi:hypothetical protein